MSSTGTHWYVVNEVPAPHLVCHKKFTQVDGYGDEVGQHRQEVTGPVSVLTEHEYVVNDDGTLGALCGTRTRLVVRAESDVMGNGFEYGITPSVLDDDDVYKSYVFSVRNESPSATSTRPDEIDRSAELRDLHAAHSHVMKMLAEITQLRDETTEIRDAALRAASANRK